MATAEFKLPMSEMERMYNYFREQERQASLVNFVEPVDANVVPNPNAHRHLEYPRALHNHTTRQSVVVHSAEERASLGADWVTDPPPEQPERGDAFAEAAPVDDERMESLENRMLSMEQMLAEIRDALPRKKRGE